MIHLQNVFKSFKDGKAEVFHTLSDINLRIKKGECVVVKGVSGSGKSTLLSIIGAIMKPSSGSVKVEGENVASLNDFHASRYRKYQVGFVTQSFNLFEQLSVSNNLVAALVTQDFSSDEIEIKIAKALHLSNITHKANQKISTLSGGEKQRCIIARALVNEPSIILCDEPTANLDRANSMEFIKIMQKLKKENKTIIIATHDPLFDTLDFVDRVITIEEGKIE